MTAQENEALIRHLLESGYTSDHQVVDEVVANDYIDHGFWRDKKKLQETLRALQSASPDLTCAVERIFCAGDMVGACYRLAGHIGSDTKTISAVGMFRVRDGRVVEHWGYSDSFF